MELGEKPKLMESLYGHGCDPGIPRKSRVQKNAKVTNLIPKRDGSAIESRDDSPHNLLEGPPRNKISVSSRFGSILFALVHSGTKARHPSDLWMASQLQRW